MSSNSTGSNDSIRAPSFTSGDFVLPCEMVKILSPITPSEAMEALLSFLMNFFTSLSIEAITFTVESFIISMFSIVPTEIPEKRTCPPTCKPLTLPKFVLILNFELNRFWFVPIKNMMINNINSPKDTKIPSLTLYAFLFVVMIF